jgi:hypothetical protein
VVEHLPNKCEALSSNPSVTKKNLKNKQKTVAIGSRKILGRGEGEGRRLR